MQAGGKFAVVQLDVGENEQIATLWDRVPADLRHVDILGEFALRSEQGGVLIVGAVNNAGFVLGVDKIGDIKDTEYEAMFRVNVFGLIAMTQLLVKGKVDVSPGVWMVLTQSG